jgi:hypothetical protein
MSDPMKRTTSSSSVTSVTSTKSTASQLVSSQPIPTAKKYNVHYLGFVHVPGSDRCVGCVGIPESFPFPFLTPRGRITCAALQVL